MSFWRRLATVTFRVLWPRVLQLLMEADVEGLIGAGRTTASCNC